MHQRKPLVPDGGWGWVIVACSFLIHLFVVGTLYAMSVLYVSWLDAFQNGKGYTSWILSLAVAVMFGIGPLPGALSKRISNRLVVIIGGLLMFLGFFTSVFAVNVLYLIFSIGILTGVGAGCCYLPSVSMVAMYFSTKRSAAMGISASGLGVGAFLMPLYLNWMVENYGWRGCMLILSGLSLNMCVLGLLMRPLESAPKCRNCKWVYGSDVVYNEEESAAVPLSYTARDCDSTGESDDGCEECDTACGVVEQTGSFLGSCRQPLHLPVVQVQVSMADEKKEAAIDKCVPIPVLVPYTVKTPESTEELKHLNYNHFQHSKHKTDSNQNIEKTARRLHVLKRDKNLGGSLQYIEQSAISSKSSTSALSVRSLNVVSQNKLPQVRLASLNDIQMMMAGSLYNVVHSSRVVESLINLQSHELQLTLDNGHIHIAVEELEQGKIVEALINEEKAVAEQRKGPRKSTAQKLRSKFVESMGVYLRLIRHGTFMLFCTSNFLTNLSFFMPVLYMVDRAIDEGFTKSEAAMLVSVYGAGNIFGKLFFGWLSDRGFVDRLVIYICCLTVCGAATSLSPLCDDSHLWHCIYSFSFGCFIGAYCTLFPIVTVDLVGLDVVDESFGILLCFMGVATAFGAPLAGSIFDLTGSYSSAFVLHGAFILISAMMLVPLVIVRSCKKRC